jgi:CRP/FNR family transcriptional regulator, cyclic AMP receptor protein
MSGLRISVLDEDRELAQIAGDSRAQVSRAASAANVIHVPVGNWDGLTDADAATGGFGLLVLGGLLVRRVGFDGRFGAELLGPTDLLRPWEGDGEASGSLPIEASWRVMTPVRMAVLDLAWATRMAPYPHVAGELTGRALRRSRRLVASMAIVQVPRLDERLWMLFWELADRWGRVHADGVHLDLPLTHELLSHLAAARRPSVSGALTRLADSGRVRRVGRSWVLTGAPPDPASGAPAAVASPG